MNYLTDRDNEILNGLKKEYDSRCLNSDFGFIMAVPTWHIRIELDNKYTSSQIRYTLTKLEGCGFVKSFRDGMNVLWRPLQENNNE